MASRKPFYEQGVYFGRVLEQALTTSNSGTVQFVLRCKIVAYPNEEENNERTEVPERQQYERTIYMPLTDKTMEFQVQNLATIGFDKDNLSYLSPSVEGFHDFKGQEISLYCRHEPDYKDANNQVERWQISTGPREIITKEVDAKQMRNLNALFGKAKRKDGGKEKSSPARIVSASAGYGYGQVSPNEDAAYGDQGITDDDIPF